MIDQHHGWNKSFKPLMIGYTLAILITVASYHVLTRHHLTNTILIWTLISLAVFQALTQLIFFLHIGLESKPRWNLITFLFATVVLVIIIFGSIWIMQNLGYYLTPKGL